MQLQTHHIDEFNQAQQADHKRRFDFAAASVADVHGLLKKLTDFQVAIPSWALGTGGTRFGRFPAGGEPRSLEEKIEDVGLLHRLNASSGAISLHIPVGYSGEPNFYKSTGGTTWLAVRRHELQHLPGPEGPGAQLQIWFDAARGQAGAAAGD
jgi:L-rhamnose isomerase